MCKGSHIISKELRLRLHVHVHVALAALLPNSHVCPPPPAGYQQPRREVGSILEDLDHIISQMSIESQKVTDACIMYVHTCTCMYAYIAMVHLEFCMGGKTTVVSQ